LPLNLTMENFVMARYFARVDQKIAEGLVLPVDLVVDLKTAKALAQVSVDKDRADAHRRQVPLQWYRTHSDRVIRWFGFAEGEVGVIVESV